MSTTRTYKFMGAAYSTTEGTPASLIVSYNGTQVFNGTVPTSDEVPPRKFGRVPEETLQELFTFTTPKSLTGNIPLVVSVSGGTLYFGTLICNNIGESVVTDWTDRENPVYVRLNPLDMWDDINRGEPNFDGKANVKINGTSVERVTAREEEEQGNWAYKIADGSTFTCDVVIPATWDWVPVYPMPPYGE